MAKTKKPRKQAKISSSKARLGPGGRLPRDPRDVVDDFADEATLPDPDFLKGPWTMDYDGLIRNDNPAHPPRVGPDYFPNAVLTCLGFRGDTTHRSFLRRNIGGNLPVEPAIPFDGTYSLGWNELMQAFDGQVHLDLGRVTNSIYFIMRDRNTMTWVVSDSTNSGLKLAIRGTAHRVMPIARPDLTGRWVTNYSSLLRVTNAPEDLQLGRDYSPDLTLACFEFGVSHKLKGQMARNTYGDLPIGPLADFKGAYKLGWNADHHIFDGELYFQTRYGRLDRFYFIMRDADTIDWVLIDSSSPHISGQVAKGCMRRVLPI